MLRGKICVREREGGNEGMRVDCVGKAGLNGEESG